MQTRKQKVKENHDILVKACKNLLQKATPIGNSTVNTSKGRWLGNFRVYGNSLEEINHLIKKTKV